MLKFSLYPFYFNNVEYNQQRNNLKSGTWPYLWGTNWMMKSVSVWQELHNNWSHSSVIVHVVWPQSSSSCSLNAMWHEFQSCFFFVCVIYNNYYSFSWTQHPLDLSAFIQWECGFITDVCVVWSLLSVCIVMNLWWERSRHDSSVQRERLPDAPPRSSLCGPI